MAKRVEASDVLIFGGNLGRQSESRHFTFTESTFPMLEFFGWMLGLGKTQVYFFCFWKGPSSQHFRGPRGSRGDGQRGWAEDRGGTATENSFDSALPISSSSFNVNIRRTRRRSTAEAYDLAPDSESCSSELAQGGPRFSGQIDPLPQHLLFPLLPDEISSPHPDHSTQ